MGSTKALVSWSGKAVIAYAIDVSLLITNNLIISSNGNDLEFLGFPVVKDLYPVNAPLAGIHAGLKSSPTEWNLVLSCDMPNLSRELIDMLLCELGNEIMMILPQHDGFLEPLCGFYHKDLVPVIESSFAAGKLSMIDLCKSVPHKLVSTAEMAPQEIAFLFRNVNEMKDLPGNNQ